MSYTSYNSQSVITNAQQVGSLALLVAQRVGLTIRRLWVRGLLT